MQKSQEEKSLKETIASAVKAIQDKKGEGIVDINIDKFSQTVCKHFIICSAQSTVQVQAIAESVEDQLKTQCNRRVYHKEGVQNGIWILLDFIDIVVHVFQTESRQFYNLEGLWGDGIVTKYSDNPEPKTKA